MSLFYGFIWKCSVPLKEGIKPWKNPEEEPSYPRTDLSQKAICLKLQNQSKETESGPLAGALRP